MKQVFPYLLAMLGMALGVFIAILFGVNEDFFKNRIKRGLEQNQKINAIADIETRTQKLKAEADKNWRYYQRYHFHATGIGAMSLALLIFLSFVRGPETVKLVFSYVTSIGGFFYPFVWLFAAIYGPEMGRSEAKEAFALFGYSGGLFLVGILGIMFLTVRYSPDWKTT